MLLANEEGALLVQREGLLVEREGLDRAGTSGCEDPIG
jgi:hypothetical protein